MHDPQSHRQPAPPRTAAQRVRQMPVGGGMTLLDLASWLAPAATMIAAIMTASNAGTRMTGWGFVLFCSRLAP